jgi:hypothetical protein
LSSPRQNPPWLELLQLVPVISLALPFIASGQVDLSRAGTGMLIAALLTLPIGALVQWLGGIHNPILLGTALWLWLGAAAFNLPLPALEAALVRAQGFGLFAGVLIVGVATTWLSPHGFIGCRHDEPRFVRRTSLALLALAAIALGWSFVFRHNIRLGGGLPFIVLNVVRRVIVVRATRQGATATPGG